MLDLTFFFFMLIYIAIKGGYNIQKNKIKFGYINKKLIAGTLALTLLTTSLVGCSSLEYETNEKEQQSLISDICYEDFKELYFVVIYNKDLEFTEFYITRKFKSYMTISTVPCFDGYKYCDILTNELVFSRKGDSMDNRIEESNKTMLDEFNLDGYLYANRKVESMYTVDDVRELLEYMKEDYQENYKEKIQKIYKKEK